MNVLIVEDDAGSAELLELLMRSCGHTAVRADTGKAALTALRETLFHLMLLDIFLPDATGYELLPQIRNLQPDIQVIAMTGRNTRELERKVRSYGVLAYMSKPIETRDIRAIVHHISQKHNWEKEEDYEKAQRR